MVSIHLLTEPGNACPASGDTGLRHLSRCDVIAAVEYWLKEMHVARRTNDPDGADAAEAAYDRYCDELDRRDAIRAAREARRIAKLRAVAYRRRDREANAA